MRCRSVQVWSVEGIRAATLINHMRRGPRASQYPSQDHRRSLMGDCGSRRTRLRRIHLRGLYVRIPPPYDTYARPFCTFRKIAHSDFWNSRLDRTIVWCIQRLTHNWPHRLSVGSCHWTHKRGSWHSDPESASCSYRCFARLVTRPCMSRVHFELCYPHPTDTWDAVLETSMGAIDKP